ncbi:prepilin-type N-terminal cleavage/methylation domain-containing protein [Thermus thalpophilus]|uniref:prepilin-type N-terminal cleavage/methylation domain-containing protein n=1 Tax=Thermus thalpophilus TaxID=2908147 RepID=UPI001FAAAC6D|nr:prepilin-type N-terminal cleavage/methylation domain-containing protein [Thermus thalpophilus]
MKRHGFTLLELLLATAILVVLGALVARALLDQADLARRTQARNEVQDRARMVLELVKQDLLLAGSSRYVSFNSGASFIPVVSTAAWSGQACSASNPCLQADAANATAVRDRFSVRYVTSLRPSSAACRKVAYSFSGTTLQRSDVACGSSDSPQPLADNILALNVVFECANGTTAHGGTPLCSGSYPRAAKVTVVASSLRQAPGNPPEATSFTVETASGNSTISCPPGYICYALTERVELPSLKDQ